MYADNNDQEEEDLRLQALTDVEERYKSCSPLIIQCPSCHSSYQFPGVFNIHNSAKCGLLCATDGCQGLIRIPDQDIAIIKNTVHLAIDQFISQYYDREWVCNDPTCLFKTRSLSLQGNFCPKIGCGSIMRESYSAEQLLNQIRYFKFLFDCDAAKDYIKRIRKSFVYLLFFKNFLIYNPDLKCDLTDKQIDTFKKIDTFISDNFLKKCNYFYISSKILFGTS
ncbi:hypothetical protein RFI_18027 [Reticulomyxa filosa]|uniref:Zinc finger DNA-directed DNA polymerase family B alpha domain-containing protein n=1 Tax=Reticulomyxa filosa TaxID=46433 RepID=X6MZE6_RETFI|nr:hypothetical protein RFI_18027 [Reticulomyxa filosa]|eukprot:ETO19206.1 hypothetical protein RFI_18027 [Reticulomyxa filosa]